MGKAGSCHGINDYWGTEKTKGRRTLDMRKMVKEKNKFHEKIVWNRNKKIKKDPVKPE